MPAEGRDRQAVAVLPERHDTRLRVTWEAVDMPADGESDMGLFGLNFDIPVNDFLALGISGYGSATGERGGFFTGGLHALGTLPLARSWAAEAGFFVGAGGGGAAPQGGGRMQRAHLGLSAGLDSLGISGGRFGLHAAHVEFPNGEIDSAHPALALELPWPVLMMPGPPRGRGVWLEPEGAYGAARRDLRVTTRRYFTSDSSRDTRGERLAEEMTIAGIEYREWLSPVTYAVLDAGGAAGGGTDGYAEITLGMGARSRSTLPVAGRRRRPALSAVPAAARWRRAAACCCGFAPVSTWICRTR